MTSWIWEVSARAMGMDFPYGLVGSEEFQNCLFRIRPLFFKICVWF